MIYLDYSANTPVDPAVLEAFCKAEQTYIGNPNSTHCAGRAACEEMARVTDHIAGLLGVEPAGIIQRVEQPGNQGNRPGFPKYRQTYDLHRTGTRICGRHTYGFTAAGLGSRFVGYPAGWNH